MPVFSLMQNSPPQGAIKAVSPDAVFQFPSIGSANAAPAENSTAAAASPRMLFTMSSPSSGRAVWPAQAYANVNVNQRGETRKR